MNGIEQFKDFDDEFMVQNNFDDDYSNKMRNIVYSIESLERQYFGYEESFKVSLFFRFTMYLLREMKSILIEKIRKRRQSNYVEFNQVPIWFVQKRIHENDPLR